jgi:hypothetical protein
MKKIDENILKYFAGLMNTEELERFEAQLKNDPELKNRFDPLNDQINEFRSINDIELNGLYFENMIPKLREKMRARRKYATLKKYSLAIPALAIILILYILIPFYNNGITDQPVSLANEIIKNINDDEIADNLINDFSMESALSYSLNGNGLDLYLPENVSLSLNSISPYVDISGLDYAQFEDLSNPEFEKLYNNLSMITFEKVSK